MIDSELDNLIICKKCQTLQKRIELQRGEVAKCVECDNILYRDSKQVFNKALAFSITALVLFILMNIFPIMNVYIAGVKNSLTVLEMVARVYQEGFYIVASVILVVVIIAPLAVLLSFILIGILSRFKGSKEIVRSILIFLTQVRHWAMVDIFFISILVALVKLFGYAQIEFDTAFIALILFIIVDIFTLKSIKPVELWQYFNRIYRDR
jgi:paraquat-inducible protein A